MSHTLDIRPQKILLPAVVETFERLRLTAKIANKDWFDLLEVQWIDYHEMKSGQIPVSEKILERVAQYFDLTSEQIITGRVDFTGLALRFDQNPQPLPERYLKAAYGKRRTSITSIDYLERALGWRLKLDALTELGVSMSALCDPFAPVSMQMISDLVSYLHRRQFCSSDFFAMGAYSYEANKDSLVGLLFSRSRSIQEVYELFFGDAMKIFEQNCSYKITHLTSDHLTLEVLTNPDVGAEAGVRHLGNRHLCDLKRGMISATTRYVGLTNAMVRETSCVHRGDTTCRFEVDFSTSRQACVIPPFSMTPPATVH